MNANHISGVEVSVNVNGRPVRMHSHEGRIYIESREGTEYTLEIKNNNSFRVEVVASVDGIGVINGKPASKTDRGYLIPAYGRISIKGYRKDDSEVGAFKFTRKERSYAKERGGEENVGVIALAVFSEKIRPVIHHYYHEYPRGGFNPIWTGGSPTVTFGTNTGDVVCCSAAASDSTVASVSTSNLLRSMSLTASIAPSREIGQDHGTTWGQAIQDHVVEVEFDRGFLLFTSEIYYDSRESLLARGIPLTSEKLLVKPRGFPSDYATPPENWRG